MSNFRRFRSTETCPVCGKRGKCAELEFGGIVCFSVRDSSSDLLRGGWRYVKPAKNGMGSVVVESSNDEQFTGPVNRIAKKRPQTEHDRPRDVEEDRANLTKALARQRRRHELYKQLLSQLTLSEDHRKLLREKRGLTDDQIDELFTLGFRSIEPGAYLLDEQIPAIDGDGIYRGKSGFLIPSLGTDEDGQLQLRGFQVAVNEEETNGSGKYIWLSDGSDQECRRIREPAELDSSFRERLDGLRSMAGVTEDEDASPLFHYRPKHKVERIALTDGALKTFVTGMRQGIAAFGAPAFNYASCLSQLLSNLENLMGLERNVRILISADAGDLENALLLSQLVRVATVLDRAGFDVRWADLHQERGKATGEDIDEANYIPEEITTLEMLRRAKPSTRRHAKKTNDPKRRGIFKRIPNEFFDVELPFSNRTAEKYPKTKRFETLKQAIDDGYRVILMKDPTGLGKSTFLSRLKPEQLEELSVDSLRILSNRYLDQSAESGVDAVYGRGFGVKMQDGLRRVRQSETDDGSKIERSVNCHLAAKIHQTYQRNISSVGSGICRGCQFQEQCKTTQGFFLFDRALAISKPVTILHPGSLKSDMLRTETLEDGTTIRTTGLAFDDVTADAMIDEVEISISRIPALAQEIKAARVSRALPDFLLDFYQQFSAVKTMSSAEIEARLRPLAEKHLRRGISWAEAIDVETSFVAKSKETFQAWLPALRQWVLSKPGHYRATFRIYKGTMVASMISERLRDSIRSAEWVLFTDATQTAEEVAAMAGVHPDEVKILQGYDNERPPAPLTIRQISGIGALGYSANEKQKQMLKLVLETLKKRGEIKKEETAIIDTKARLGDVSSKFAEIEMGWMSDSRGSNRANEAKHLVMIGSPRPNLGAAAARYQLMFGELVDLEHKTPAYLPVLTTGKDEFLLGFTGAAQADFRRYYVQLLEAELLQGIGRIRHNCRGSMVAEQAERLTITVIGDVAVPLPVQLFDVKDFVEAEVKEGLEVAADAARLNELISSMQSQGQEVSQHSLAGRLSLPKELVEQLLPQKRLDRMASRAIEKTLAA